MIFVFTIAKKGHALEFYPKEVKLSNKATSIDVDLTNSSSSDLVLVSADLIPLTNVVEVKPSFKDNKPLLIKSGEQKRITVSFMVKNIKEISKDSGNFTYKGWINFIVYTKEANSTKAVFFSLPVETKLVEKEQSLLSCEMDNRKVNKHPEFPLLPPQPWVCQNKGNQPISLAQFETECNKGARTLFRAHAWTTKGNKIELKKDTRLLLEPGDSIQIGLFSNLFGESRVEEASCSLRFRDSTGVNRSGQLTVQLIEQFVHVSCSSEQTGDILPFLNDGSLSLGSIVVPYQEIKAFSCRVLPIVPAIEVKNWSVQLQGDTENFSICDQDAEGKMRFLVSSSQDKVLDKSLMICAKPKKSNRDFKTRLVLSYQYKLPLEQSIKQGKMEIPFRGTTKFVEKKKELALFRNCDGLSSGAFINQQKWEILHGIIEGKDTSVFQLGDRVLQGYEDSNQISFHIAEGDLPKQTKKIFWATAKFWLKDRLDPNAKGELLIIPLKGEFLFDSECSDLANGAL